MTNPPNGSDGPFEILHACPATGGRHLCLPLRCHDRPGVYVGHPILAMEDDVAALFRESGRSPDLYLPMRSTHLGASDTGANEYAADAGLFSGTRHFTSQNRCDAVHHADAVLLNYDVRDDAGAFRLSRGIPFDLGWARAHGKPVVAVIRPDNPNFWPGLADVAEIRPDIGSGVAAVARRLPGRSGMGTSCLIEVLAFPGDAVSLPLLARLAEADARKCLGTCAAVLTVMPGGRANPNWHGQVGEVSDWLLPDMASAVRVAEVLRGGRLRPA
jgi:nucleoside 2-deoxyribosyltransferase